MYKKCIAILLLFFTCNTKSMCFTCCFTCIKKQKNKKSLHYAAQNDDTKRIQKILRKKNIDIDIKNKDEETPLFVAIKNNKKKAATLLLNNGANPNTYNKKKETPLMHTIDNESPKRALLLLEKGAHPIIEGDNLDKYLVEFYAESPSSEKIQENYKFIVPVHSYLLRKKLIPLYEQQQQREQKRLHQTVFPLSNSDI